MKNYSLKYKFLGLIIFLFLSSFIAFFYIIYDFQKQKLKILKDEQILKIDNSFNKNIEKHLKNYYFDFAKRIFDSEDDYEIKLTIKENDRKKLEEIIVEKYVTVSIGASFYNSSSDITKLELLLKADEALYNVKNSGRNNFAILEV